MPPGLRPSLSWEGGAALAQSLASATATARRTRFVQLLQSEPGLCVWAVLAAYRREQRLLQDVFETWEWLGPQLATLFEYPLEEITVSEHRLAHQLGHHLARERARDAWRRTVGGSPATAHQAYFTALLSTGWRSLRFREQDVRWTYVPDWLADVWRGDVESATTVCSVGEQQVDRVPERFESQLIAIIPVLARQTESDPLEEQLEQRKRSAVREFAYGAGHELNNPLAIIMTRAQSLIAQENDPDKVRALASIVAQAQRGHNMIADLMLYAKPVQPRFEPLDLTEILTAVVTKFSQQVAPRGVSVEPHLAQTPLLWADRTQMEVLAWEALKNAEHAVTAKQGSIHVRLQPLREPLRDEPYRNGWLRFEIEDDGPGLDPRAREHLFDPFFSGREAGRGLGFGLCKAWQIVVQHCGKIHMDPSPQGGCRLVIDLPLDTHGTRVVP